MVENSVLLVLLQKPGSTLDITQLYCLTVGLVLIVQHDVGAEFTRCSRSSVCN
jgi:hypothetical protein